jgi:hypothetical protein
MKLKISITEDGEEIIKKIWQGKDNMQAFSDDLNKYLKMSHSIFSWKVVVKTKQKVLQRQKLVIFRCVNAMKTQRSFEKEIIFLCFLVSSS